MTDVPTLFLLHGLGCSARLWRHVEPLLDGDVRCVALDLPGHGAQQGSTGFTVEQMVDEVLLEVRRHSPRAWGIGGHSMGGKIAALVAARAERGVPGLTPPLALVLVSASPLSPEPMSDDDRAEMIGWATAGAIGDADAQKFVDANTATPLPGADRDAAVADVRATNAHAWLAWLERGSREDWRDDGPVHTTTVVVAGAEDDDLGPAAQRRLVLPLVNAADVISVPGAAHLIPLEAPVALADIVRGHLTSAAARLSALPSDQQELLRSDRVGARTRSLLVERVAAPIGGVLGAERLAVLGSLVDRLLPQDGTDIDLAARLDAQLAAGVSDGWRFAALPGDVDAWRRGLDTIAADIDLVAATPERRDDWIERAMNGEVGSSRPELLEPEQMVLWLENVRAETVRAWLSHPAAQHAIGYDGYASGGDGVRLQGYLRIGERERDDWQSELPERRSAS